MAKKGKKRNREGKTDERSGLTSPSSQAAPHSQRRVRHSGAAASAVALPLDFPGDLFPVPRGCFLRDEPPFQESFRAALDTSYEGFAVDLTSASFPSESSIQTALQEMEQAGFFRTDVTQPFGLGTKCAKTYVTRCLVGEEGTTYRYLGLRMFAYPWDCDHASSSSGTEKVGSSRSVERAMNSIRKLNKALVQRTQHHLAELSETRKSRGAASTKGRAAFDIALINRMVNTPELKKEPTMGEGRCSVSWHADSSLEHYSTIAVYQTIEKTKPEPKEPAGTWSVALRVAHHAEGPTASHRSASVESSIVSKMPTIAVSLPSGSAYYLLDDFNHHHQHAVVASGGDAGIRYSSTHRLLRESHNVKFLMERCCTVCSNFHKKGPKIWRSEQLLLTEVEAEWIRQFYVQGEQHYELLWNVWGNWINQLLECWSKLESRTKQCLDLLQSAAEGRCCLDATDSGIPTPSRRQRKLKERRKKAAAAIQDVLSRNADSTSDSHVEGGAETILYKPLAELLEERATMRELWIKRENDSVFGDLNPSNRPLKVPFKFGENSEGMQSTSLGASPLPGDPDDLRDIASSLRSWGKAFDSAKKEDLSVSGIFLMSTEDSKIKKVSVERTAAAEGDHVKSPDWEGWSTLCFGLEMQSPWAELLLEGKKKVETRAYDLPPGLIGRRIEILQSGKGEAGVSAIGNVMSLDDLEGDEPLVRRVGWCTFKRTMRYADRESFEADEDVHLVTRNSGFGWKNGSPIALYGWAVSEKGRYSKTSESRPAKLIVRRMRSLFELCPEDAICEAKEYSPTTN